jgi:hypothetical protein
VIAIAAVLCAATSPPRYSYPRSYPAWKITDATVRVTECAEIKAWVSRSGKSGVGVTVRITPRGTEACDVRVAEAALEIGGARIEAIDLPESSQAPPGAQHHLYIPFAFDNEASWNRGERTGMLILRFDPGPELKVAIEHHRGPPHHKLDRWERRRPPQPQPQLPPAPRPPLERAQ